MRLPGMVPDAEEILTIHEERDSGLSAREIGARHELSGLAVTQLLRGRSNTTMPTPFEVSKRPGSALAVPLYWLGFIAACGRAAHRAAGRPLVLSIDVGDREHVRTMLADLLHMPATYEFCYSSHEGHQVYIRDRDLGEAATHWGVITPPRETALPVDRIPAVALPHFLRGLIEGQVHDPPFGGRRSTGRQPSPQVRRLAIPGSPRFLEALQRKLRAVSPALEGNVEPAAGPTSARLTFARTAARAVLRFAYRDPVRFSPRAARFVQAFGPESAS